MNKEKVNAMKFLSPFRVV